MKVFVVNLARCTERMERVKARLDTLGVPFERFEAIDEGALDEAEKHRSVSTLGWWCCSLRPITRGKIGCALSHLSVYRKMLADDIPYACVLEDDVILSDHFPDVLARVEAAVDETKPQVLLLFDHTDGRMDLPMPTQPFALRPIKDSLYAEGYVLTRPAAEQLIQANYPLRVLNDIWGRWVRQGRIRLFAVSPASCTQSSIATGERTVCEASFARKDLSFGGRFWWDVRRLVGIVLDAFTGWPEMKGSLALLGRFLRRGR